MTHSHSHTLAATIARAIFDRIERDRTLILQNIKEVIRDQLAIEGARRCGDPVVPDPFLFKKIAGPEVEWGSLKNWWQAESNAYEERRRKTEPRPWRIT